jgi:hypothetical protein
MQDLLLKVIETETAPNREWTSELWEGFPGAARANKLAGGMASFTQKQLEASTPGNIALDRASVLDKIRNQDKPDAAFAAIGMRLYELLEQTGTATEWRRRRDRPSGDNAGTRTYLDLPEFLTEWPWELLAWRLDAGLYRRAFNERQHPVLRIVSPTAPEMVWDDTTVRILLVSGQEALDAHNSASDELRLIRKVFQAANLSVMVDLCEAPENVGELQGCIASLAPHVLHFIGHGDILPAADFALEFKRTTPWEWSANQIYQFLSNLPTKPRLVVLNSCHSSRREAHAAPVTAAILKAGVPAVIGALASLQVDYARHFSEAFYTALAARGSLDQAMVSARLKLSNIEQYSGLDRRHWALPVLTVQAPAQEIVKFKRVTSVLNQCDVAGDVFSRPGKFVNRTSDRWSMLSALRPADPTAPRFRGVIVDGVSSQVGKSWLIKRVMRDFLDSDFLVRYATLVGLDARTSLDVLEDWRGRPNLNSPLLKPLPGRHFDGFDQALAAARQDQNARNIDEAFRTFKAGFQSVRQGKNVLFVLGRFREDGRPMVSSQDFREHLLEKLLRPIQAADPPDPEVEGFYSLLIVRQHHNPATGQSSDLDEFSLEQISYAVPDESTRLPVEGFRRLTIREFSKDNIDRYLDEFAEFAEFAKNRAVDGLRTYVKAVVSQPTWSPQVLKIIEPAMTQALARG